MVEDLWAGRGLRRGLGFFAIAATATVSPLVTFLIPPARDTWVTLIDSILNPMTHYTIGDWIPLIPSLINARAGSVEQKYFVLVLLFFAAAFVSVLLTPRGGGFGLLAVCAMNEAAACIASRQYAGVVVLGC